MPTPRCTAPNGNLRGRKVVCPDCGATFPPMYFGPTLLLPVHLRGEQVR